MLVGAWGARAGELLERATSAAGGLESTESVELTMLSPPSSWQGSWCCWLFGEPEDRDGLPRASASDPVVICRPPLDGRSPSWVRRRASFCAAGSSSWLSTAIEVAVWWRAISWALSRWSMRERRTGSLFAEHERDLLDLLPRTPGPDRLALLQWIDNGVTLPGAPSTRACGVCPPGHRLRLDEDGRCVERWWNLRYAGDRCRAARTASRALCGRRPSPRSGEPRSAQSTRR